MTGSDQAIGTGDGTTAGFQLAKTYEDAGGATRREIAKPVAGTLLVSVDGTDVPPDRFTLDATTGRVTFSPGRVPGPGAVIRAGFEFDVPVRFDTDRIEIDLAQFRAGRIPTIPLTEILP